MSQLYYLKNGSIGHYCDVYKEEAVERLGKMPRFRLASYVNELIKSPAYFGNDAERLRKTLKAISSVGPSVSELNKSLEVVAEIEYHRIFSSDKEVSEPTKTIIKNFRKRYD